MSRLVLDKVQLDVNFDFRSDTPKGKDPDSFSRTLKSYHKALWSKKLPGGGELLLRDDKLGVYLYHESEIGSFRLSSDTGINTYRYNKSLNGIVSQIQDELLDEFLHSCYTIGSMMVFPGNRVNGKATINGARGFSQKIKDRFDLTLECIRLYYLGHSSPLVETLNLYSEFFKLFEDFRGYVEFFHLQDLVTEDFSSVRFFLAFDGFMGSPLPGNVDQYLEYKKNCIEFISLRGKRISQKDKFF